MNPLGWRRRRAERRTLTVLGAIAMGFKTVQSIEEVVGFWPATEANDLAKTGVVTTKLHIFSEGTLGQYHELHYLPRIEVAPVDDTAIRVAHQRVKDLTRDQVATTARLDQLVAENDDLRTALARYTIATETNLGVTNWCLACCGNQHHACQAGACACPCDKTASVPDVTHHACVQAYERGQHNRVCPHCFPRLRHRPFHTCKAYGGNEHPADCGMCGIEEDTRQRRRNDR